MKFRKYLAMSTMQVSSSITIIPPEPTIAPVLLISSYVTGVSIKLAGIQPPDGPPICTALNCLSFLMPPPMPNSTSFKVMPIGTSTRPPFLILPASANTLVPLEASVPNLPNAAPPLKMIQGTFASVSTLLMSVGFCQKPFAAGNGGFRRGIPLSPSRDAISAVSSPHTNAPAPALM